MISPSFPLTEESLNSLPCPSSRSQIPTMDSGSIAASITVIEKTIKVQKQNITKIKYLISVGSPNVIIYLIQPIMLYRNSSPARGQNCQQFPPMCIHYTQTLSMM